jgi:hypothetical protein
MAQGSPPHHARALIVEDEVFFAINLEADMHALGFDICDLAANGHQASECRSCLRGLVSAAGGRRAACWSLPAFRRLGRHHHWRFALPVAWLAKDAGTRHLNDRCMGPVRCGRPRAGHHPRREVGRRLAFADLQCPSRVSRDAAVAMVICSDCAGSILADFTRDHLGPASSLAKLWHRFL